LFIERFKYLFRGPRFALTKDRGSSSVLLFIHGIFSKADSAFTNGVNFFWDRLDSEPPFLNFDVAQFDYSRTDFGYLIEWTNPFNNLSRLADDLHGYLQQYSDVFIIGHSQGGLLGKVYACKYHQDQGVFLITLHTPHRDRSAAVMRSRVNVEWSQNVSNLVPHLFAGSIHDRIVKPDQARDGCTDIPFTSYEKDKVKLGHSHLSSDPDPKLIGLIKQQTEYYLRSGFQTGSSRSVIRDTTGKAFHISIVFSRSALKLKEARNVTEEVVVSPWGSMQFGQSNAGPWQIHDRDLRIEFHGVSINFLRKHAQLIIGTANARVEHTSLDSVDPFGFDELNEAICEASFRAGATLSNPYAGIRIDINDFPKRSLVYNEDFAALLLEIVQKRRLGFGQSDYEKGLNDAYVLAVRSYRQQNSSRLFDDVVDRSGGPGLFAFDQMLEAVVRDLGRLNSKTFSYKEIYSVIKKRLIEKRVVVDIKKVERIISSMFRSDGHTYCLDRDLRALFQNESEIWYTDRV